MRSKYVKDMDPKLTRVNVGEGLEGFEAITHWSERRETLADHLLACLMQLYGNRQVSLLVMHGVMMGVERARADDTGEGLGGCCGGVGWVWGGCDVGECGVGCGVLYNTHYPLSPLSTAVMELSAKALGNQVEEPMWWSLVEIKRLMEGRMESHTDFEVRGVIRDEIVWIHTSMYITMYISVEREVGRMESHTDFEVRVGWGCGDVRGVGGSVGVGGSLSVLVDGEVVRTAGCPQQHIPSPYYLPTAHSSAPLPRHKTDGAPRHIGRIRRHLWIRSDGRQRAAVLRIQAAREERAAVREVAGRVCGRGQLGEEGDG